MSKTGFTRRGFLRGNVVEPRPAPAVTAPWEHRARAAALVPSLDREARVLAFECIGPTSFCSTCVERCPVDGALRMEAGRPVVDTALCDGCGACEEACPAPRKAIVVIPRIGGTDGRKG